VLFDCLFILFFKFSDPETQLFLATQTLLLTMHLDDIDTRPLPSNFVIFYDDWKFFIIALMVEMGIFTALALFLKPLH